MKSNFSHICKKVGVGVKDRPTLNQKRLVLLLIIQDFLTGKISLDELSGFGQYMDEYPEDDDLPEEEEYKKATFSASELSFEFRRTSADENFSNNWDMKKVLDYYQKYKYLLEEL